MLHSKTMTTQENKQTFDRLYTCIRERKGLTNNDRVLFAYMLNKYEFFKKLEKPYKENQEDLAEAIDVSLATLKRCLKTLVSEGLLSVEQHKGPGFTSYSVYKVVSSVQPNSTETKTEVKPELQVPKVMKPRFIVQDDEDECPF